MLEWHPRPSNQIGQRYKWVSTYGVQALCRPMNRPFYDSMCIRQFSAKGQGFNPGGGMCGNWALGGYIP